MCTPFFALAAVSLTFAATSANAQQASDRYAYVSITQGDLQNAEQKLLAEQRIAPGKPEVLLNLAAIYAKTGRTDAARAAYNAVLAQDDILMDLSGDRTIGSHTLASAGLSRLSGTRLSAR